METLSRIIDFVFGFKAYVMLPLIIFALALLIRMPVGQALLSALKLGVGFAGIFILFGFFVSDITPAVNAIVTRRGLDFPVLDVGWPPLAAITWASPIAPLSIPLVLLINMVMLATNTTRTVNIDIWNYWHFALVGALVQRTSGSLWLGLAVTGLIAVYGIKLADWNGPLVERQAGLTGISITTLSVNGLLPVGLLGDKVIERIPGLRRLSITPGAGSGAGGGRWRLLGEPMMIGVLVGLFFGLLAGYGVKKLLELSVEIAAVMFLLPFCGGLIGEGMEPVSLRLKGAIQHRFPDKTRLYVGMDSGVLMKNPSVIVTGLLLMPLSLGLAFLLPGNRTLPLGDLANLISVLAVIVLAVRGNVVRGVLIGLPIVAAYLLIATWLAPLYTTLSAAAGMSFEGAEPDHRLHRRGQPGPLLVLPSLPRQPRRPGPHPGGAGPAGTHLAGVQEAIMMQMGLAHADITPREAVPLLGYGDRTHDSSGVHDPLRAAAWWLHPEGQEPLCQVVLDLCLLDREAARGLTDELARRTGLDPARLLLSTTHTHSAPDVRALGEDSRPWAVRYRALLLDGMAEAVRKARAAAFPGRLEVRAGSCDLGTNRRGAGRPVDPRVVLLSLMDGSGSLRGLLFHYSCHLTVLGVDNYQVSADWLAPVRAALEGGLGVPVAFLQGAEGDIDPVCRGVLDMSDPDQAVGSSFEVMEQMGGRMALAVREALGGGPLAVLEEVRLLRAEVSLPLRHGALSPARVEERVRSWKGELGRFLGLPDSEVPEDGSINARIKERCRALALSREETRRWVAEQFAYTAFLWIYRGGGPGIDPAGGRTRLPLTLLDFGPLLLLGVPAEVLVEAALDWQARFPGRIALIGGLTGGWTGYLPHGRNWREPDAPTLYETVSTLYAEGSAETLLAMGQQLAGA